MGGRGTTSIRPFCSTPECDCWITHVQTERRAKGGNPTLVSDQGLQSFQVWKHPSFLDANVDASTVATCFHLEPRLVPASTCPHPPPLTDQRTSALKHKNYADEVWEIINACPTYLHLSCFPGEQSNFHFYLPRPPCPPPAFCALTFKGVLILVQVKCWSLIAL